MPVIPEHPLPATFKFKYPQYMAEPPRPSIEGGQRCKRLYYTGDSDYSGSSSTEDDDDITPSPLDNQPA